jgi:hypothetical protein
VRFAAITLCVASQRVFIVVSVYFVIDSVRMLLDTVSEANLNIFICEMKIGAFCAIKIEYALYSPTPKSCE